MHILTKRVKLLPAKFLFASFVLLISFTNSEAQKSYLESFWTLNTGVHYSVMSMSNAYYTNKTIDNDRTNPLLTADKLLVTDQKFADKYASIYPHFTAESFGKTDWGRGFFYFDLSGMTQTAVEASYKLATGENIKSPPLRNLKGRAPLYTGKNTGGLDVDFIEIRIAGGPTLDKNNPKSWAIEPGVQLNVGGHSGFADDEGTLPFILSRTGTIGYGVALNAIKPSENYMLRFTLLYNRRAVYVIQGNPGNDFGAEACIYIKRIASLNLFYHYTKTNDLKNVNYKGAPYRQLDGGTNTSMGMRLGINF
ncbi:MAG: hypothetical protein NTX03_00230 [Bacteroidetes bacterium]|nr:hypothetical protein [Bacteroidota bacterium]